MKFAWVLGVLSLSVGCTNADRPGRHVDVPDSGKPDSGDGEFPDPTIKLAKSTPADGAVGVPRTTWIRLDFTEKLPAKAAHGVHLDCGEATPEIDVDPFDDTTLVVNPRSPLPAAGTCLLNLPDGSQLSFDTAADGGPAVVPYDRNDTVALDPFPDDYYLVADQTKRTGVRVDIRVPNVAMSLQGLFAAALEPANKLDGMSPLAPIAVRLPDAIDASSIPKTTADSLDPFATLGLFDIDPKSKDHGKRIPFETIVRDETNVDGTPAHMLVVFPSIPLAAMRHYAFVVTGRALVNPSRPLQASSFFEKVATSGASSPDEKRLEPVLTRVLTELRSTAPPLRADDLALALGITVRSLDDIPADLSSIREQTLAAPPPAFTITSADADTKSGSNIAAIVRGTWSPPNWSTDKLFIDRDAAGKPSHGAAQAIPFILALPKGDGPAPVIMYQHGQPGSSEREVPQLAREGLAKAGFAVIGFTDYANRVVIPDGSIVKLNTDALTNLLTKHQLPDYLSLLTHAEQLAFIRMISTLDKVDVLPLGSPDGKPDIDPTLPLGYFGISQGSFHGTGLLAFAPEIHAAALTVGAGRFSATLVHQASEVLYQGIGGFFPTFTHADFYSGLAVIQMDYDHQDSQNLARYLYREPLSLETPARASVLQTEGLGDTEVPFYSSRSGAYALGIPQLEPHARDVPFLKSIAGPVQTNMGEKTTAAFFQYVPDGNTDATPTPGCVSAAEPEGHYCAQIAAEAWEQRVNFFTSALAGVPRITAPGAK
jgi:hypothetical protein